MSAFPVSCWSLRVCRMGRAGAPLVDINPLRPDAVAEFVEDKDDGAEQLESTHVALVEMVGCRRS
jgi:hypothetical protein